jgi:hypothetical protein
VNKEEDGLIKETFTLFERHINPHSKGRELVYNKIKLIHSVRSTMSQPETGASFAIITFAHY